MSTKIKTHIIHSLRWMIAGLTALTLSIKIAEVSAYETLQLLIENPELAQYSTLVQTGYLIVF